MLAGASENIGASFLILLAKGVVIIALVIVSAKWVVPQVLYQIARTGNRELFLLSIVLVCTAVAWLTAQAGLSLALGGLSGGIDRLRNRVQPSGPGQYSAVSGCLCQFLFSLHRYAAGCGLSPQASGDHRPAYPGGVAGQGRPGRVRRPVHEISLRTAVLVGLALCQVGEFSFILSKVGQSQGLFSGNSYQLFLVVTMITMVATPLMMALAPGRGFYPALAAAPKAEAGSASIRDN